MKLRTITTALLSGVAGLAILGGCNDSGTTTITPPVTMNPTNIWSSTIATVPSGTVRPDVTYNPVSDTYTVKNFNVTLATLSHDAAYDQGSFRAYTDGSGNWIWAAVSGSGDVNAAYGSVPDGAAGQVAGAQYTRSRADFVPASGTASYTGSYAGVFVNTDGTTVPTTTSGDATMNADFGAGTVTGAVTNRIYYNNGVNTAPSGTMSDLMLSGATLDSGGNFTGGTATGGGFTGGGPTSGGSYEGVIGGTGGDEIAAGVVIYNSDMPGPEIGGIVGAK